MDERDNDEHQAGPAVQGQRRMLPIRAEQVKHADDNRQDQRQRQEQQQPEGRFVCDQRAPAGPVIGGDAQPGHATQEPQDDARDSDGQENS